MLDLRRIHLGQHNIASFQRKADALKCAKARGWYARDVRQCFNRFCIFWIVYQPFPDCLRIATKDGSTVDVVLPVADETEE